MKIKSPKYTPGESPSDAHYYLTLNKFEAYINNRLSLDRLSDIQYNIDKLSENQLQQKALNFELLVLKQNNEFDILAQQLHQEQMAMMT